MNPDYLGTFNKSQIDRFLAFAKTQLPLVEARIQHLSAQQNRIGAVTFRFDQGIPVGFSADPPDSYMGRLLAAYEVLGGNPFHSLRLRAKTQPIFLVRGTDSSPAQFMSHGEVVGARGLADAPSAVMMAQARQWLDDTLHYRFGALERKLRRSLDYFDQLQEEIDNLTLITQAADVGASLAGLEMQLQQLIADPNYRAIFDDKGADHFGLTTYAPFSSYDATKSNLPDKVDRVADGPQRQNSGYVGPGEKG